ncbi:phage baseplate assembly protein V [Hydrogenovibrio sp. 3SP14C1]|uniref:phage baseplate assembly protein V n=1 Tax=Hydrogenovibrio sp. 3SP14C1 TaxID=3038774 RepID=UPI002417E61C|nr:phage baseplate assembly protein V [Hydrogenovibrio sp. 3SP14C1]MDG4811932.1 phage baseplate assembly protein V [Hydrogenovibrio sp. 3SP14C1]
MIEYGKIEQQDFSGDVLMYRVRMSTGELSPWMIATTQSAGTSRKNAPLSKGTQVAVFMPSIYEGIIFGAINSKDAKAVSQSDKIDRTEYDDGAVIEYDQETHSLKATLPAGGKTHLDSSGGITFDGDMTLNGNMDIQGDLSVSGDTSIGGKIDVTGNGSIGGNLSVAGICGVGSLAAASGGGAVPCTGGMDVTDGDLVANGISLTNHAHIDSQGGTTSVPS